jgi:cytochrome c
MQRASALLALGLALLAPTAASAPSAAPRILVFTKTTGFRHTSIPAAIQAVRDLGAKNNFDVDPSEDGDDFTDANLKRYAAVVFLLTTGDVLNDPQQSSFERFIRAGGGWVGLHSAADTEYDWPWYGGLVGAYFMDHPAIQQAVIDVADPRDPSTAALPPRWTRTDEWYNFRSNPRPAVHVAATLEESSYDGGEMGADHPFVWWHPYDGGRAWYTAGGHTEESYGEPLFLALLLGGIQYAAGVHDAPSPAPPRITSLTAKLHGRRVAVTARYSGCPGCTGQLRVGTLLAALTTDGTTATGTSPALPRGHRRVIVVLSDPAAGVRLTASRPLLVR